MSAQNGTLEKREPHWYGPFLEALAGTGNVRLACQAVGVGRTTAYRHRDEEPGFRARWDEAHQDAMDLLEQEAWRRAREGVNKPVIHNGKLCGVWVDDSGNPVGQDTPGARQIPLTVKEYSDTLLIFLLKGGRPEKFRERFDMHHGGGVELSGGLTVAREEVVRAGQDVEQYLRGRFGGCQPPGRDEPAN